MVGTREVTIGNKELVLQKKVNKDGKINRTRKLEGEKTKQV